MVETTNLRVPVSSFLCIWLRDGQFLSIKVTIAVACCICFLGSNQNRKDGDSSQEVLQSPACHSFSRLLQKGVSFRCFFSHCGSYLCGQRLSPEQQRVVACIVSLRALTALSFVVPSEFGSRFIYDNSRVYYYNLTLDCVRL